MGELKIVSHAAMLNLYDREKELADICSALADPTRRKIIKVINLRGPSTINEIAWQINVPVSTTSYHVKELINAGLLIFTTNTKRRGNEKTVARGDCRFDIFLADTKQREPIKVLSYPIPIGSYTDFVAEPTCGIILRDGSENVVDNPAAFYSPRRAEAGLIWLHSGYLEYSVPLLDYIEKTDGKSTYIDKRAVSSLSFKFELCSEAPMYNHDYESDITFSVNGVEICTFISPGDYGERRGKLTPPWHINGNTQYGLMYNIDVRFDGSYLNEKRVSDVGIEDVNITASDVMKFRIEVKKGAVHEGGFNIFGSNFGDYPQDIVLDITYLTYKAK